MHITLLGQLGVDAHDLGRRGEAVVGAEEDLHLGPGGGDQLLDEAVELLEVAERQLAHALVKTAELTRLQRRVDIGPGLVLQLVDAVEQDRHQFGRLFAHQMFGDAEPLLLARQVVADPLFAVGIAELVARLLFLLEIPGQFLGVEAGNGLQPVVHVRRVRVAAQVSPGHEARDDEAVQVGRGRRGEREVQRRDLLALPAGDRPDRLDAAVARVVQREEDVVAALFGADEVEHTVVARPAAGHHRHPGGRRQRVRRRAQLGAHPFGHHLGQEGHDDGALGRLCQIVEHGECGTVHADEERADRHAAVPPDVSLLSTKAASVPSVRSPT